MIYKRPLPRPQPPGGDRFWAYVVAAFFLVMTLVCAADRLGWFE